MELIFFYLLVCISPWIEFGGEGCCVFEEIGGGYVEDVVEELAWR